MKKLLLIFLTITSLCNSQTVTITAPSTFSNTTYNGVIDENKSTDIASSPTLAVSAMNGNYAHVTGTVTITSLEDIQAGAERVLVFDNSLTITSNSVSLILRDNMDIITNPGDIAIFRSEGGGNHRLISYFSANNSCNTYTPTFTGYSSSPTLGVMRYCLFGKLCFVSWVFIDGTSNATSTTMTLPYVAANTVPQYGYCIIKDNGVTSLGELRTRANSNIADVYKGTLGTWTASGAKNFTPQTFIYEIK